MVVVEVAVVGADQASRERLLRRVRHLEQEVGHRVDQAVVVVQHEPVLGRVEEVAVAVVMTAWVLVLPRRERRDLGVVDVPLRLHVGAEPLLHPGPVVGTFVHSEVAPFGVGAVAQAEPDQALPPRPGLDVLAELLDHVDHQRAERVARGRGAQHALPELVAGARVRVAGRVADPLGHVGPDPELHHEARRDDHVGVRGDLEEPPHHLVDAREVVRPVASAEVLGEEVELDDVEPLPRQPDDRAFVVVVAGLADVEDRVVEPAVDLDERAVPAIHDARDGIGLLLEPGRQRGVVVVPGREAFPLLRGRVVVDVEMSVPGIREGIAQDLDARPGRIVEARLLPSARRSVDRSFAGCVAVDVRDRLPGALVPRIEALEREERRGAGDRIGHRDGDRVGARDEKRVGIGARTQERVSVQIDRSLVVEVVVERRVDGHGGQLELVPEIRDGAVGHDAVRGPEQLRLARVPQVGDQDLRRELVDVVLGGAPRGQRGQKGDRETSNRTGRCLHGFLASGGNAPPIYHRSRSPGNGTNVQSFSSLPGSSGGRGAMRRGRGASWRGPGPSRSGASWSPRSRRGCGAPS